ncbi:MAG: methionyl-tRNA formyltransferase [Planctomycetota bacterium]|nr:methionyl-tRNA formyltransferase [Planctomycetota bacterium]
MRLAFFGSPPFATPILERCLEGAHEVCGLVTGPDRPRGRGRAVEESPLAALARERGLALLQPQSARDEDFAAALTTLAPEALLVVSYGQILPRTLLALAPLGALNVHASLLPRHRGASPVQAALRAGDEHTGVCVQRMVFALDEGDVVLARSTPIGAEETAGELLTRLSAIGADLAAEALDLIAGGRAVFTPQEEALATYAPKLTKADGVIDWSLAAVELDRHVRSVTPWPGARTRLPDGRPLGLARPRPVTREQLSAAERALAAESPPGTLLRCTGSLIVHTGEGALEVRELTPAGKRTMPAEAWLRGARLAAGALLGGER